MAVQRLHGRRTNSSFAITQARLGILPHPPRQACAGATGAVNVTPHGPRPVTLGWDQDKFVSHLRRPTLRKQVI